jgi:acetylornithine/N-succinyldiaminopimelate aminotransferase
VIVAADRGFHGRTMGALAITGKESIREPFAPFGLDVRFVPYGDADALRAAVDERPRPSSSSRAWARAASSPPRPATCAAARAACDRAGALLVLDEIQSGIGRTGAWFAHQAEGVTPTCSPWPRGSAAGCRSAPASASATRHRPSPRATTARRSAATRSPAPPPWPCSTRSSRRAARERQARRPAAGDGIEAIDHPLLAGVRGSGLWLAAVLTGTAAADVEAAARQAGFLVNAVQPDAIRLAPPLILTRAEAKPVHRDALPAILTPAQGR